MTHTNTARDDLRAHLVTGVIDGMHRADELIDAYRDQVLTEGAELMAYKGDALRSVVNPGQLAHDLLLAARTTQEG